MATIIDGNGVVSVGGTSSSQGEVKLYEDTDNGSNYVALKAPASISLDTTWTLPNADGTNGQALGTDGSGTLSFITVGNVTTTGTQTLTNKTITGTIETRVAMAASNIDLSAGNYFTKTITATTTLTVTNVAASGSVSAFVLQLTNGGSQTVNWFSGVDWPAATPPTLTASGVDVLAFFSHDGGTTWYGFVLGQAMA
jgi:hypothetical protein